ncbi:hypothetical protein [Actinokineospora bangkokensis]|uniref:Uncharacterized protein n=1 Tax=Actinokineospora bangkokensis TaxID=1193682 RepID=A0A1Q9LFW2_9PSEU|nr:hypothetical protein [Actinokineospora bangkokensis]OLR90932.1 hypothetical protein BJP25_30730 [Actinokineospora bangkokensis]
MRGGEWVVPGLVTAGVLVTPLVDPRALDPWVADDPAAVLPFALALSALAAYSVLRGAHVWADPARLTWEPGDDRDKRVRRRLLLTGGVRFAAVFYAAVVACLVVGEQDSKALISVAGFGAAALVSASRKSPDGLLDPAAAVVVAYWPGLWVGLGTVLGSALGGLWRPKHVPTRDELVRGWRARQVRSTSVLFGDLLGLLPAARPVRRLRVRGAGGVVLAGALGRWPALPLVALVVLTAPLVARVVTGVPGLVWVAVAAYLAALPFAGALAEVHRVRGLARWVPARKRVLVAWTGLLALVVGGVAVGGVALLGLPFEPLAAPVAALAVLRTVTRPQVDYAALGVVPVGMGVLPVGLVYQVLRGPDLLAAGALLVGLL